MIELQYYAAYRQMKRFYDVRYKMVRYALENNISQAAWRFGTTRPTVRKWLTRYLAAGESALLDESRRPQHSPRKIADALEKRIVTLRSPQEGPNHSNLRVALVKGPLSLKEEYNLPCRAATIYRVLRQDT